jgi:cysteamine dioxygenase
MIFLDKMSKIEKVMKCACTAFSPCISQQGLQENIYRLEGLMSKLVQNDVKLQESLEIIDARKKKKPQDSAPVTYIDLIQCSLFSAGIFIIQKDCKIPLHDHPGMTGILKVLHGCLRITSYDTDVPTLMNIPSYSIANKTIVDITPDDKCLLLNAVENNVHEISAVGGSASFLDILAPPYDYDKRSGEKRICNYYSVKETIDNDKKSLELHKSHCPFDFWCDDAPYLGPSVSHLVDDF